MDTQGGDPIRAFFVGIGGCGMSGLARLFRAQGVEVSGSDSTFTAVTTRLRSEGFAISFDQSEAIPGDVDLLVVSAAIKPDHPQMLQAVERGVRILTYAEALGEAMRACTGIAVAGTHGKSTTSAMLGCVLADASLDPSVIVGATCAQLANGALTPATTGAAGFRMGAMSIPHGPYEGRPGLLICEACEFNRSFHNLHPVIASISAVEADHLDIYGSLDAVVEAFKQFASLLPSADEGGRLLIAHDGAHRREVTAGLSCAIETIGFNPEADWVVQSDAPEVTLRRGRDVVCTWTMALPGQHNAMNAAFAAALAISVGAAPDIVGRSLSAFRGVERRTECLGDRPIAGGSVRVYDDYGHHPTEIEATLRALREHERPEERRGRLICVFQPHQHSRTRFFLEEFASAFSQADLVIVPQIYFVRDSELERSRVSATDLVDRLRSRGVQAMHLYPFEAIVEHLEHICAPNDLLVVMGAGPVWQVAHGFMGVATAEAGV